MDGFRSSDLQKKGTLFHLLDCIALEDYKTNGDCIALRAMNGTCLLMTVGPQRRCALNSMSMNTSYQVTLTPALTTFCYARRHILSLTCLIVRQPPRHSVSFRFVSMVSSTEARDGYTLSRRQRFSARCCAPPSGLVNPAALSSGGGAGRHDRRTCKRLASLPCLGSRDIPFGTRGWFAS